MSLYFTCHISSEASVRPLLAEVVLALQRLSMPREVPICPGENSLGDGGGRRGKSTSVIVLNAQLRSTPVGVSYGAAPTPSSSSQGAFGYLLADAVDYSVRLRTSSGSPTALLDSDTRLDLNSSLKYHAGENGTTFICHAIQSFG
jgi:hypothetical protein